MSFLRGTEEYYQKFIELQEKLRRSEEERLKLEIKFNEMVQVTREEEQAYYRKLRSQYKRFLEEDRRRQERNERIIRLLERIEGRAAMLAAKTERFELLRKQYHAYLQRIFENINQKKISERQQQKVSEETQTISLKMPTMVEKKPQDLYGHPAVRKVLFDDVKANRKVDIVKEYLNSLSKPTSREDVLKATRSSARISTDFSDNGSSLSSEFPHTLNTSNLADEIINSIYSKPTQLNTRTSKVSFKKPKGDFINDQGFCDTRFSEYNEDELLTRSPRDRRKRPEFVDTPNRNYELKSLEQTSNQKNQPQIALEKNVTFKENKLENIDKEAISLKLTSFNADEATENFDEVLDKIRNDAPSNSQNDPILQEQNLDDIAQNTKTILKDKTPNLEVESFRAESKEEHWDIPLDEEGKNEGNFQSRENGYVEQFEMKQYEEPDDQDKPINTVDNKAEITIINQDDLLYNQKELDDYTEEGPDEQTLQNNLNESKKEDDQNSQQEQLDQNDQNNDNDELVQYEESQLASQNINHDEDEQLVVKSNEQERSVVDDDIHNHSEDAAKYEENEDDVIQPIQYDENKDEEKNESFQYEEHSEYGEQQNDSKHQYDEQGQPLQYDDQSYPLQGQTQFDVNSMQYPKNDDQIIYDVRSVQEVGERKIPYDVNQYDEQSHVQEDQMQLDDEDEGKTLYLKNNDVQYDDIQPVQQIGEGQIQYDEKHYDEQSHVQDDQMQFDVGKSVQHQKNDDPIKYDDLESIQSIGEKQISEQNYVQGQQVQLEEGKPIEYPKNDQMQYDGDGQPVQLIAEGKIKYEDSQYYPQYDVNGQPIQQYYEDGQPIQSYEIGQPIEQYDENGQLIQQYYENEQQYDENGQPIQQYDESGQPIRQYDENGQPIQQYAENQQPILQYDENGQPIYQYDPNSQYYTDAQEYENPYDVQTIEQPEQAYSKEEPPDVPIENIDESVEKLVEDKSDKRFNVMDMLDTDTESMKQETKVSNDSDFDFSNS